MINGSRPPTIWVMLLFCQHYSFLFLPNAAATYSRHCVMRYYYIFFAAAYAICYITLCICFLYLRRVHGICSDRVNQQLLRRVSGGGNGRTWIHPPDALQRGHIAYLVKVRDSQIMLSLLGATESRRILFFSDKMRPCWLHWGLITHTVVFVVASYMCEVDVASGEGCCQDAENYFYNLTYLFLYTNLAIKISSCLVNTLTVHCDGNLCDVASSSGNVSLVAQWIHGESSLYMTIHHFHFRNIATRSKVIVVIIKSFVVLNLSFSETKGSNG